MRWFLIVCVLVGGCATVDPVIAPALPDDGVTQFELTDTPFFPQRAYHCGPAALATVLGASGVPVAPDALVNQVYIPGKKGSLQIELVAATRRHGRLPYPIEPKLEALIAELTAGRPVLVLQNLGFERFPWWHYAVVVGYRTAEDRFILRSGTNPRQELPAAVFMKTWKRAGSWGIVSVVPGELPARPEEKTYLGAAAALEQSGQVEEAQLAYGAASELWPESEVAVFGLANTHHTRGALVQAEALYQRLLSHRPDHGPSLNNLARVLADQGCYASALLAVERAIATGDKLSFTYRDTRQSILRSAKVHIGRSPSCRGRELAVR